MSIVPSGVEVARAQVNRVPTPSVADYVIMTPTHRDIIEIPVVTWDTTNSAPVVINMASPVKETVQLDIHGPNSPDTTWVIASALRSFVGSDLFRNCPLLPSGAVIEPLYTENPRQIPFINGEQQYENRWIVEVALQADINITISQDFASALVAGTVPVDLTYPP